MMQPAHLTAWQAYAPWPKRSQIEQDLRLPQGVAAVFGDEVRREHLAPAARYSEDIDLVLAKAMDTLDRHLRRVLTSVLGKPSDSRIADAWLAISSAQTGTQLKSLSNLVSRPVLVSREDHPE